MNDVIEILFPDKPSTESLEDLKADLLRVEEVSKAGVDTTRSIGAGDLSMWIGLTANALSVAAVGSAVLRKIIDRVKNKGIKKALIALPNGARISIDAATPDMVLAVVAAWKEEADKWSGKKGLRTSE